MERQWLLAAGAIVLLLYVAPVMSNGRDYDEWANLEKSWPNQGGGISNRREALFETKISKESVTSLSLKWTFNTGFEVSAGPAIDAHGRGAAYFSSWDGCLYAVTKDTGELIWKLNVTEIAPTIPGLVEGINVMPVLKSGNPSNAGLGNLVSRATPTIAGPLLVFGIFGPCYVLAVKRSTGALVWWNRLDSHPFCGFTQSGTYYEGSFYIGTSSLEEEAPANVCCYFQGAFFKLDAKSGETLWRVRMLPDNHNRTGLYSGAAIWGSSPAIDVARRLIYIATGNTYTTPPSATACELARLNETHPTVPDPCIEAVDHSESFVAISIDGGEIAWATHLGGYDTWTAVCRLSPVPLPNCPPILGPDYDFGEAPVLLTVKQEEKDGSCTWRDIVVAGQKSGVVHALDRATGAVVWQTDAGPGGTQGGASWGISTDGERVFTNIINNNNLNFTLVPSSKVITWAAWVGINASTGAILWTTANSAPFPNPSPIAYANGVVFGGSAGNVTGNTKPLGSIVALDSITGEILWEYTTQGGLAGGVSIVDGCIFQPVGEAISGLSTAPTSGFVHGHSTISLCVP